MRLSILIISFFIAIMPCKGIASESEYLKVCADPYMLPFSNLEEQGYENKIAELLAEKLNREVQYTFFPQRIGFIRNTLKSEEGGRHKCDLVITVPENFELAATTQPYYTTSYMLLYVKGRNLPDDISSSEMFKKSFLSLIEQGKDVKIGLSDRGPAQLWVFYNDMMANVESYQGMTGNPKVIPGQQMMEDLIAGKTDAAVVMGQTAGFFAKKYRDQADIVMIPLEDDPDNPNLKFKYRFSMAVRYGEKEWKDQIQQLITENQSEIQAILKEYNIPLLQ